MYDYNNGRFLSVDPFIQNPGSTQSLNPYTYIFNNPLSGIDPTGYCSTTDDRSECGSNLKEGESEDITNESGDVVGTVTAGKDGSRSFTTATGKIGAKVNNAALNSGIAGDGVILLKKDKATSDIGSESEKKSRPSQIADGLTEFITNPEHIKNTFKKTFDFAVSEGNQEAAKTGALLAIPIPIGWFVKVVGPAVKSLGTPLANWIKVTIATQKSAKLIGGLVDPKIIRFTQNSIKSTFKDGRSISKLTDDLKSGLATARDVPAIRVFIREGNIVTLDNRRLKAFQDANVLIRTVSATQKEIAKEAFKFTSKNGGTSIRVRGGDL
jgi:hypothetical protein